MSKLNFALGILSYVGSKIGQTNKFNMCSIDESLFTEGVVNALSIHMYE